MGTMKSGLNLVEIFTGLQKDITLISSKDLRTVVRRLEHEGVSFLTKTLPLLGKALDSALETGLLVTPCNFKRYKTSALPCLFRGLLSNIFEDNGSLLQCADTSSIKDLRQVCYLFNKIKTDPTPAQRREAVNKFLAIEEENKRFTESNLSIRSLVVLEKAKEIASSILEGLDLREIVPSDGPGAVADKRSHQDRLQFNVIYGELHGKYPYYSYYFHSSSDLSDRASNYFLAKKLESGTSRFCLVPKDSRGPRIITIEPAEYQYIQQGQRRALVQHVENHPETRGFINFSDQGVNNGLAEASSSSRRHATLDLSDASDRVTARLVELLVGAKHWEYLNATRTKNVNIPKLFTGTAEDTIVPVDKFAGMGSALCFPIEALSFYCLVRAALLYIGVHARPYVYGDDIIIPNGHKAFITEVLAGFNLKVNELKSFEKGFFRESCGGDYFKGVNVTPIRLRVDGNDPIDLVSLIETCNQLHLNGLWATEKVIHKYISTSEIWSKYGLTIYSHNRLAPSSFTQYFSKSSPTKENLKGSSTAVLGRRTAKFNRDYQKWTFPTFIKKVKRDIVPPVKEGEKETVPGLILRWSGKTKGTDNSARCFTSGEEILSLRYL